MMQRVLIVGFGSIGQRHLRIVRESLPKSDVRLLRREPGAMAEGADGFFYSLDDALAFKPQVAIIANPAPFHVRVALALASQGCHLLVEKPLSDTLEGVSELLLATSAGAIVLQVGYNLRFSPSLRDFKKWVQSGHIGRILSIRCETGQHLETWRPGTDYRQGVSACRELGGGALLELSHELDYLRWIFGDIDWVGAWMGKQSALEINVEDTAHLLMGLRDSPVVAGACAPVAALSLDFLRRDTTRRCVAIGETGSLVWDGIAGSVRLCIGPGNLKSEVLSVHSPVPDETYREQWRHFLSCVENKSSPLVSGHDGMAVVELVKAAWRSVALGGARVHLNQAVGTRTDHG
jgi:predicted dehydrogenase